MENNQRTILEAILKWEGYIKQKNGSYGAKGQFTPFWYKFDSNREIVGIISDPEYHTNANETIRLYNLIRVSIRNVGMLRFIQCTEMLHAAGQHILNNELFKACETMRHIIGIIERSSHGIPRYTDPPPPPKDRRMDEGKNPAKN